MNKKIGVNFVIFFLTIAIIILSYSGINDFLLKQRGVKTEGIVTNLSKHPRANRIFYTSTYPMVRYMDSDGKDYTIMDCENCHKIGEKVPIIYDPRDPRKAVIDTKSSDFSLIYYVTGFVGFLIFFIILKKKTDLQ